MSSLLGKQLSIHAVHKHTLCIHHRPSTGLGPGIQNWQCYQFHNLQGFEVKVQGPRVHVWRGSILALGLMLCFPEQVTSKLRTWRVTERQPSAQVGENCEGGGKSTVETWGWACSQTLLMLEAALLQLTTRTGPLASQGWACAEWPRRHDKETLHKALLLCLPAFSPYRPGPGAEAAWRGGRRAGAVFPPRGPLLFGCRCIQDAELILPSPL